MKNQSLFDAVETALVNFAISSARGDHAQNWHALRLSPSGEIYTYSETSPCFSESEFYGQIPHTLTIHSERGNCYTPTVAENPGWFVRDDGTLDLDCWVGDRPFADEVCDGWRDRLQQWIDDGNYTE